MNVAEAAAGSLASKAGASVARTAEEALNHPEVTGVLIATSSDTHAKYVTEAVQAGKAVEAIAKLLNNKGNVVLMMGELATQAAVLRTEGVEKVVAQHPEMKIVGKQTANWRRNEAIDLMNNWLVAGTKIDAVVANNDEMAIGAILALQQAGKDPKKVVIAGIDATADALDEMGKGNLAVTVFQDAKGQGKGAVETAVKLIKGEKVESFVWIPFELVTPENYKDYLKR